jgi:hypothetical protein
MCEALGFIPKTAEGRKEGREGGREGEGDEGIWHERTACVQLTLRCSEITCVNRERDAKIMKSLAH